MAQEVLWNKNWQPATVEQWWSRVWCNSERWAPPAASPGSPRPPPHDSRGGLPSLTLMRGGGVVAPRECGGVGVVDVSEASYVGGM